MTLDFLGFTHYCSRSRGGIRFRMKRKTIKKRFIGKLKGNKDWIKANRTLPTAHILKITAAKMRGHFTYYDVTYNGTSIRNFAYHMLLNLLEWLHRRGKQGCYTWEKLINCLNCFRYLNRE
jgi:RNA-directed DNA polymerase